MTEITDKDVYVYRELYYETQKPLIMAGARPDVIKKMLIEECKKFGWTIEKYDTFASIDLMQRIAKLTVKTASEDRIFVKTAEGKGVEYHATLDMPELKCPKRTTQID